MYVQENGAFSKVANAIKIEIFETGFADLDREWRKQDMCSPYSRLYYVISGMGYLRLHGDGGAEERPQQPGNCRAGERLRALRPGYLYLIPNGLSYDYFCEDRLEKVYIHFNVLLQNSLELFSGCRNLYELPITKEHLEQMKRWMTGRMPEDFFCLQGEVYHAVAAFINAAGVGEKVNRQYSDMVTRLFTLLPGMKISVSVSEIAQMMNVSDSTLAKHFKKETGMSIGRYREQLIMNRARQLLATGNLPIGEIAEELGFTDQFYFSKYFKQRQKMTPSAYKMQYKN